MAGLTAGTDRRAIDRTTGMGIAKTSPITWLFSTCPFLIPWHFRPMVIIVSPIRFLLIIPRNLYVDLRPLTSTDLRENTQD